MKLVALTSEYTLVKFFKKKGWRSGSVDETFAALKED